VLVVCLGFHLVKVGNLAFLLSSTYDLARWPGSVFRGALAFVFTFVFPFIVMTTYPALALLGRIAPATVATTVACSVAFALLARVLWLRALRHYTSAGG
jgi:ABC-2 type transport system permease protein